jgi:hypothetical protein
MPVVAASLPEAQPIGREPTNAFTQMVSNGKDAKLSLAQLEAYLAENRRSAESLVTAFRLTDDRALLLEAAEKFPRDPRVNFAGWFATLRNRDASPEERRQWLDAFKQSAPDNALANYLSA